MTCNNNTSGLSNMYTPDFQAWSEFYESRLDKNEKVGFGFKTEQEALNDREQLQQIAINQSERAPTYSKTGLSEPKIVNIISPTEQTLQQAESVMQKSRKKQKLRCGHSKCKSKNNNSSNSRRHSVIKPGLSGSKKSRKKNSEKFNYRNLRDLISKKKTLKILEKCLFLYLRVKVTLLR